MGHPQVEHQPREALQTSAALGVVEPLAHEDVEVELVDHRAAGQRHQGAADDERIARDERRGAIAAQLGRAAPLQQRGAHRRERQGEPCGARQSDQDQQRGAVELVIGEDVSRLMREHRAALGRVQQPHEPGLDDHNRFPRADRHRVGRRNLGEIEVGNVLHVERRVGERVLAPDLLELLLGEAHRGAEIALAQRTLVAELDQLAHDLVQMGDRFQGGARAAVGWVLEGPRRDSRQLVALGGRSRLRRWHPLHTTAALAQGSTHPLRSHP